MSVWVYQGNGGGGGEGIGVGWLAQDRGADGVLLGVYPGSREVTVGWGLLVGLQTSVDDVHVPRGTRLGSRGPESPVV